MQAERLTNAMTKPTVTVLIDTYNQERFIEEAIRSVLDQDFPREQMEILVVDDGSTDRTPEIVRQFEPQVKLLQKSNGGQASAINQGVAHASGEFVAFLDGDDVWLPHKLSRVVAEFRSHPEAVLVYHNCSFWDPQDGREWEIERNFVSGDVLNDRRKLRAYWAAPTSSLVFRRVVLNRLMPVPEQCSFNHDTYLISAVIFFGPVAAIPERLTRNRVHGQNLFFAGRGEPDRATLQRRIEVRDAAIRALQDWMLANAPAAARSQARFLVRRWRLGQDADKFVLEPPGRFVSFAHQIRRNLVYGPFMTRGDMLYDWTYALAVLAAGQHAHYLAGVRTRVRRLRARFSASTPRSKAAEPGAKAAN
jgi:glycosyltransferase involved in cell wall biosynthesis